MFEIKKGNCIIRVSDPNPAFHAYIDKHFSLYWDSVEPHAEGEFLVMDFSKPALQRYRNGREFVISSLPEETAVLDTYFRHAPARGRLAFDIGAYCGVSTYETALRFNEVIAFEPDAVNRRCLLHNIAMHSMSRVRVVPAALDCRTGTAVFYAEGSLGSRLALPEYTRPPLVDVDTMTLTDACEMFGVPDHISMDIEGAEIPVLESSRELLTREKISLVIDTYHDAPHGYTFGRVESILRDCGYFVETGIPGGCYTTWGWK